MAQTYDTNSVADYLKSKNLDSSVSGRAKLAFDNGLVGNANEYLSLASQGKNADINNQLLTKLRANENVPPVVAPVNPADPSTKFGGNTPISTGGPITSGQLGNSMNMPEATSFIETAKTPTLNERITQVAGMNLTDPNQKAIDELKSLIQMNATKEKDAAKTALDSAKGDLNNFTNANTTETALNSVYEKFKLEDNLQLYSEIQTRIVDAQNALNMGLIYEKDRPARLRFTTGSESTLRQQGLAAIGALQGTAAVIKGNIDLAKSFADSTIDAINVDNERSFKALNTLIDLAENEFITLSENEKTIIDSRLKTIEENSAKLQQNKDDILGYMTTYPRAFLKGGVTLLDSKEKALEKMLPVMAADEKAKLDAELYQKYKVSGGGKDDTKAAEEAYKGQLLAGKAGGMTYSEAILAFGDVLDPNYINAIYGQAKTTGSYEDMVTDQYYKDKLNDDGTVKAGYEVTIDPKNGRTVVTEKADEKSGFWNGVTKVFGSIFN